MRARLLILFILALMPPAMAAAQTDAKDNRLYSQARSDLEQQRYRAALAKLNILFTMDPADPDINFHLGRAAFESGDYETAVMAFERVLIMQPEAVRVKLELARAYYKLGSYATARQYFLEVLETEPPEAVRRNIMAMLGAVSLAENPHVMSGAVSIGVSSDDNANVAPISANILVSTALGNLPITTTRPKSDQIRTDAVTLSYAYQVPQQPLAFKGAVTNYVAEYLDETYLDVHLLAFKGGLAYNPGRVIWEIYGLGNGLRLDHHRYVKTGGFGTTVSVPVCDWFMLAADLNATTKNFYTISDKDAHNARLSITPVCGHGDHALRLTGAWEKENARNDINSYRRLENSAEYALRLPWDLRLRTGYGWQHSRYRAVNTLFGLKRSDTLRQATCGIDRTIWAAGNGRLRLDGDLSYGYTRARSNIDLYTYKKNAVTADLIFSF